MNQTKEQIAELIRKGFADVDRFFNVDGTVKTKFGKYDFPYPFTPFHRNKQDYQGRLVLLEVNRMMIVDMSFGSGDNLTLQDMEQGFDDYLNYQIYAVKGDICLSGVIQDIRRGWDTDEISGIDEIDGGMMLVRRKDYQDSGDIRTYIAAVLDMMGWAEKHAYGDAERIYHGFIEIHHDDD